MKRIAWIACLPLLMSCGPYEMKHWLVTLKPAGLNPAAWPASCRPGMRPENPAIDETTAEALRLPMSWQQWEGVAQETFLQLDNTLFAFANGLGQNSPTGFSALPAGGAADVIESADPKAYSLSYVRRTKAPGDAPTYTDTTSLSINFENAGSPTTGTVTIGVSRACSGSTPEQCTDAAYSCQISGIEFTARRIDNVQATAAIGDDHP